MNANAVITGGNFNQNNRYVDAPDIQKPYEYIAKGAFHNSQERSKEANLQSVKDIAREWTARLRRASVSSFAGLSSSTSASRDPLFDALVLEDVIKDIFMWLHDPSTDSLALWVYDDDRSRTSLIGQAVAEILANRDELAATYFFPPERQRGLSNPGNAAAYPSYVVPTIAYQLGQNIPEIEAMVTRTLTHDVSIFNLRVHEQIAKLIIKPLKLASEFLAQVPLMASANVIVVHGLEDCNNVDFQTVFLDAVISGLASIEEIPFSQKLLILGRPTDRLRECLSRFPGRILQRPLHFQRWRTREQDIERREEDLRKGEEYLAKKLEKVKRDTEALQRAWKVQLQAKQIDEESRQREEQQEKRQEELLHEQTTYAEAKGGIRKMAEKREPWIMQQIEGLKKKEQKGNARERQINIKKKEFPQYRILVIGNNRVGKTSLVRSILGIGPKDDAASSASIDHEYTSTENTRFILYDIPTFQVEYSTRSRKKKTDNVWKNVERFLRRKNKKKPQDRVHGIWFCIDSALSVLQLVPLKYLIEQEKLLSLAGELNIPVFTVFTKFDLLVNQQQKDRGDLSESELEQGAEDQLHDLIKQHALVPPASSFVKVSTSRYYPRRLDGLQALSEVTVKYLDKYHGLVDPSFADIGDDDEWVDG